MCAHSSSKRTRFLKEFAPCDSFNAVFEHGHVEVDQQSEWFACKFKVSQKLRFENAVHLGNGLQFDNKQVFDDEIESIPTIQQHRSESCWHRHLSFECEVQLRK